MRKASLPLAQGRDVEQQTQLNRLDAATGSLLELRDKHAGKLGLRICIQHLPLTALHVRMGGGIAGTRMTTRR